MDLCKLAKTGIQSVAITVDIRNLYGIQFGDTITLKNIDSGLEYKVQVHDEKAARFRNTCQRDNSKYCNKGDVAYYEDHSINGMSSGNYLILK